MSNNDIIASVLGLTPISQKPPVTIDNTPQRERGDDISKVEDDYDYTRQNLRDLIAMGMQIAADSAQVAAQSQNANNYVATAQIIKSMIDANRQLLTLSQQKKDITGQEIKPEQTVTNNLFVGSASDLQAMIEKRKKETE